jgi:hypothetical protein
MSVKLYTQWCQNSEKMLQNTQETITISNANNLQASHVLQICIPRYIANGTEKTQTTSLQFQLLQLRCFTFSCYSSCRRCSTPQGRCRTEVGGAARRPICLQWRDGPSAGGDAVAPLPGATRRPLCRGRHGVPAAGGDVGSQQPAVTRGPSSRRRRNIPSADGGAALLHPSKSCWTWSPSTCERKQKTRTERGQETEKNRGSKTRPHWTKPSPRRQNQTLNPL